MKIAITGSSGLIGTALVHALEHDGHEVTRFVRRQPARPNEARWEPRTHSIERDRLEGADALVHLAGVGVASRPWTRRYKELVRSSRLNGTRTLVDALRTLASPPPTFVSASAVGYYGDSGNTEADESAGHGSGFLAALCRDWELATAPAVEAGIRVINTRSGIVLARHGGLLGTVLPLFRLGLGGRLGSGRQYISWISLPDAVRALCFLLSDDRVSGPVNLTAPNPVTNAEFTAAIGRQLHRREPFVAPAPALRILLGDLAREGMLSGQRVVPKKLAAAGFDFSHPDIDTALRAVLG